MYTYYILKKLINSISDKQLDMEERLQQHNSGLFVKSSTKIAYNWDKFHLIFCKSNFLTFYELPTTRYRL